MQKKKNIRFRIYILGLYLLLLPIDATLGNIIGSISIVNYIAILYFTTRTISLLFEKIKIEPLKKTKWITVYFLYFMVTMVWSLPLSLNKWYIFSILASFFFFFLASLDTYSDDEFTLLKNIILLSGLIVIGVTLFGLDLGSGKRFNLNIGRYMDPNYFSTGFILITAVLTDNILKKHNLKINVVILVSLVFIVIMTGSRGGFLANFSVIIVAFILDKNNKFKQLPLVLLLLFVFLILLYKFQHLIPNWVLSRFTINEILQEGGSGRTKIWANNLSYFKGQSLLRILFGTGFATFSAVSMKTMGTPNAAHSIYIQAIIEGGIIGLTVLLSTLLSTLKYLLKSKNRLMFSSIVGAIVGGALLDIHISRFFWMILFLSIITLKSSNNKYLQPKA